MAYGFNTGSGACTRKVRVVDYRVGFAVQKVGTVCDRVFETERSVRPVESGAKHPEILRVGQRRDHVAAHALDACQIYLTGMIEAAEQSQIVREGRRRDQQSQKKKTAEVFHRQIIIKSDAGSHH